MTSGMTARDYQHKRFRNREDSSSRTDEDPVTTTGVNTSMNSTFTPISSNLMVIDSTSPQHIYNDDEDDDDDADGGYGMLNTTADSTGLEGLPIRQVEIIDGKESTMLSGRSAISGEMKHMNSPWMSDEPTRDDGADSPPVGEEATKAEKLVHKPTAKGQILKVSSPLGKPPESLKYSMKEGMADPTMRRTADGHVSTSAKNKLKAIHSLALSPTEPKVLDSSSYKIFLLLLQPKTKIFELIQLLYSVKDNTTIGDILSMIPKNATEAALGAQRYIGLCRPKGESRVTGSGGELLDLDLLASESTRPGEPSANITRGEILVAIPEDFTAQEIRVLARQILANPKIERLLKRSDPLAPKKSKRRHRSTRHHKPKKSVRNSVDILDKHDEEEEIQQEEQERQMRQAMAHAQVEAEAANSAIQAGAQRSNSIGSASDVSAALSEMSSSQGSMDDSFSSWSKSFDQSFSAQSAGSGTSRRSVARRRARQARRLLIVQRSVILAFGLMVAMYFMDPSGYSRRAGELLSPSTEQTTKTDEKKVSPMGLGGIFQCLFLLLTLYKMERFFRSDQNESERRCPFLRESAAAMKRLKAKYAAKLKHDKRMQAKNKTKDEDTYQRLRNFPLKSKASVATT